MTGMDMSAMAKIMGRRGGHARSARLSADAKQRIASMGGHARRHSLEAARRITDNLTYAAAVAELRGAKPAIKRLRSMSERLPGIYPQRP
jgi:hypothetical protein